RTVGAPAHGVVPRTERAADDHGELRDRGTRDGRDHLRAILRDAGVLVLLADHEAGDVLQEYERRATAVRKLHEVRTLQRGLREQDAVVRDDRDGAAPDTREAAHERRAIVRLELMELGTIDEPSDDLAHVERLARVLGQDAVQLVRIERGLARLVAREPWSAPRRQAREDGASNRERVRVVLGEMIGDAGSSRVHIAAVE